MIGIGPVLASRDQQIGLGVFAGGAAGPVTGPVGACNLGRMLGSHESLFWSAVLPTPVARQAAFTTMITLLVGHVIPESGNDLFPRCRCRELRKRFASFPFVRHGVGRNGHRRTCCSAVASRRGHDVNRSAAAAVRLLVPGRLERRAPGWLNRQDRPPTGRRDDYRRCSRRSTNRAAAVTIRASSRRLTLRTASCPSRVRREAAGSALATVLPPWQL